MTVDILDFECAVLSFIAENPDLFNEDYSFIENSSIVKTIDMLKKGTIMFPQQNKNLDKAVFDNVDRWINQCTKPHFDAIVVKLKYEHAKRLKLKEIDEKKQLILDDKVDLTPTDKVHNFRDNIRSWHSSIKNDGNGIPIAFEELNYNLIGFKRGKKYDFIAETGVGKSIIATNILFDCIAYHEKVKALVFNFELDAEEFTEMSFQIACGMTKRTQLDMSKAETSEIEDEIESTIIPRCFTYYDTLDLIGIERVISEYVKKEGISIVMIDYLDYIKKRNGQKADDVCRELRQIAKRQNVILFQINQINKEATKPRQDGKKRIPKASDALGGISIKSSSNGCLVLYNSEDKLMCYWDKLRNPRSSYRTEHFELVMDWSRRRWTRAIKRNIDNFIID